jgi:hypothetical protein
MSERGEAMRTRATNATFLTCAILLTVTGLAGCPPSPPPPVLVDPYLYTFSGTVTEVIDGAEAAALAGVAAGSAIQYKVIIDLDSGAYTIDNNTYRTNCIDGVPTPGMDYFYAGLQSGSVIDEVAGGRFNAGSDVNEFHIGVDGGTAWAGHLILGSNDNTIVIVNAATQVRNWVVGTKVRATETAHSSTGGETSVNCLSLNLDSIVAYVP